MALNKRFGLITGPSDISYVQGMCFGSPNVCHLAQNEINRESSAVVIKFTAYFINALC